MRTIYISLPMAGHEDTVHERYLNAISEVFDLFKNEEIEIYGPINIKDFDDTGLTVEREHDWSWYMGRDIETLLKCNTIYMTKGYLLSKGCKIELAAAQEAGISIYYSKDANEALLR
jgi:hypothetical protein